MNGGAPAAGFVDREDFRRKLAWLGLGTVFNDRPRPRPREHMPTLDEIAEADRTPR